MQVAGELIGPERTIWRHFILSFLSARPLKWRDGIFAQVLGCLVLPVRRTACQLRLSQIAGKPSSREIPRPLGLTRGAAAVVVPLRMVKTLSDASS